jgi:hypothetical protein
MVFLCHPLVLFLVQVMFSGDCCTVLAALESWWSIHIWCSAVLLSVAAIGSSYCSARLKGFGYEWFKLVGISSCSPATLRLFLEG